MVVLARTRQAVYLALVRIAGMGHALAMRTRFVVASCAFALAFPAVAAESPPGVQMLRFGKVLGAVEEGQGTVRIQSDGFARIYTLGLSLPVGQAPAPTDAPPPPFAAASPDVGAAEPASVLDPAPALSCGAAELVEQSDLAPSTRALRRYYWPVVRAAECREGLPFGLLDALVIAESRYRSGAMSSAGAAGLAQLMPATAAGLGVRDRFDPVASLFGGARYLRAMIDTFGSLPLGVAAYNAGPGSVRRVRGIPLNGETPEYVQRVLGRFSRVPRATSMTAATPVPAATVVRLDFTATQQP